MDLRKLTAIVRTDRLEEVEERLKEAGVKSLTITTVLGFGEYANFFRRDWLVGHAQIDIFAEKSWGEELAKIIMDAAHTGASGDGIVALVPVDKLYRIRTKAEATPSEV